MEVLFICTGNIFRSLTAEYALRGSLPSGSPIVVSSAGTEDFPHVVKPVVSDYLLSRGLDVREHRRRTLTEAMLQEADLVIAMSTEHRQELGTRFGRADISMFAEACGFPGEALPDVEEVVIDYRTNARAVETHVHKTIDRIIELAPCLARRLATRCGDNLDG